MGARAIGSTGGDFKRVPDSLVLLDVVALFWGEQQHLMGLLVLEVPLGY